MTTRKKKIIAWSVYSGIITTAILIITAVWSCYGKMNDYVNQRIDYRIELQNKEIKYDILYIKLLLETHCISTSNDSNEIMKARKTMSYFYRRD